MGADSETPRIVWHDLFTTNLPLAQLFYTERFGVKYLVEHAANFAWGEGAADYPLIIANDYAHGGLIQIPQAQTSYWLAYVAVEDVAGTLDKAKQLGGQLVRKPFDVPGVGTSCLIEDNVAARICLFKPAHGYAPPHGLFVSDELQTNEPSMATQFYSNLFGWPFIQLNGSVDTYVAASVGVTITKKSLSLDSKAESHWIPRLKTLGKPMEELPLIDEASCVAVDPTGALLGITREAPNPQA